MAQVTVETFAAQMRVPVAQLIEQLAQAGITKQPGDALTDDDKKRLLDTLKGESDAATPHRRITLHRKTTNQIRQTSKTGAARTVHVEVKKKRTFVKRSEIEAERAALQNELEQQAKADAEARAEPVESQPAPPVEPEQVEPAEAAVTPAPEASPESPPAAPADEKKEAKKGKKGKKDKTARREKLHASRRSRSRNRRQTLRKPGKISSSIAEQHAFAKPTEPVVREVSIPQTISVGELAQAMSIKAGEVIKMLMDMGSMVTINQILDRDTATLLVEEMGHIAKAASDEDPEAMLASSDDNDAELAPRAPVVTVMGHVDHGKTSLLDYLRKTKIAAGEAGGITQHIGAYKIQLKQGEICFLDTPGHEAFSAMRARGAGATDLVVLVVAADDGVKPQTIEAISHAKAASAPIVVAINKMDREQADAEKIRQELANHDVVPEQWGGDVLMNEISALDGRGVDELLESILLQAEVADLKSRAGGAARGLVIEARLDRGRGPVATVLVQEGVLRQGDSVLAGRETGRVRVLLNDRGESVASAGPSTPVEIQGLAGVPAAGDDLFAVADERKARDVALYRQGKFKEIKLAQQQKLKLESMFNRMQEGETDALNLVVKADVQGSVEALTEAFEKLSQEDIQIKVVHGMVGGINESDAHLALAAGAILIGFNVRADATARKVIETEDLQVHYHNVIYDAVDAVKAAAAGRLAPLVKEQQVGLVEVRQVFRAPKIGAVAGCFVTEGSVKHNLPVRVLRDNVVIFEGSISSLRRFKDDVQEVKHGLECGIGIKNYNDIKAGDQIEVFEVTQTEREL